MGRGANPLDWPAWLWRGALAVAAILVLYGLAQGLTQPARILGLSGRDAVVDAVVTAGGRATLVLFGITCLVTMTIGLFVLLRGRNNPRAVLLAFVLLAWAPSSAFAPPPWEYSGADAGYYVRWLADLTRTASFALFWPLFCLEMSGGSAKRRQSRWVTIAAIFLAGATIAFGIWLMIDPAQASTGQGQIALLTHIALTQGSGFAVLLWNYPGNDPVSRNRLKIVILAFAAYLLSFVLANAILLLVQQGQFRGVLPLAIGSTTVGLAAVAVIAYAVLRQKLFDLNFALNRTLVYGVLSFILLAAFGLAEWAVEHFHLIPEAWHEGGAVVSAGIALALFLSFHRLRGWVEHYVERLLFNNWHSNEETLRRFVAAAGHYDQAPALGRAFVEEVTRFAKGAKAALYVHEAQSGYGLRAGGLTGAQDAYPEDDRAFALMRAERRPVNLAQAHSALPGVLALPMLDQGALAAFLLLGRKDDGANYRPDEIEVLGWAAEQIGFALKARYVHELEQRIAGLSAQVASVTEERDRLASLLASPAPRRKRPMAAGSPGS